MEYHLTPEGQRQFEAWLYTTPSASIRRVRVEFLSRLYLARLLNRPTAEIVRAQKDVCQARYQELMQERVGATPGTEWLALDFVVGQMQMILHWLDRCELIPNEPEHLEDG
ncbi:hypothetical protein HC928_01645 [bacterium]|nr:hypothetical protein [bacterium]